MSIPKEIKAKLEKLLALEHGAKEIDSLNEAEVAAQKIQELLAKYNVELSEIQFDNPETISHDQFQVLEYRKNESTFIPSLYSLLGRYNMVNTVNHRSKRDPTYLGISLVGKLHNIEIVRFLGYQFIVKIRRLESISWSKQINPSSKRGTYRRGFLIGAVRGLSEKLKEQHDFNLQHIEKFDALVRTENQLIDQKMAELFNNLRGSKKSRLRGVDGYSEGKKAGKGLDLNQGLNRGALNRKVLN